MTVTLNDLCEYGIFIKKSRCGRLAVMKCGLTQYRVVALVDGMPVHILPSWAAKYCM